MEERMRIIESDSRNILLIYHKERRKEVYLMADESSFKKTRSNMQIYGTSVKTTRKEG
jgi:hypothetical protein